jgi:hypothetical protein
MSADNFLHHLGLAVAAAALCGAAFRIASAAVPRGTQRLLATAVLAAGAAVVEALGLGLVALGGSPAALVAAAVVTWVASRFLAPAPELGARDELAAWWRALDRRSALLAGAAAGGWAAWSAWVIGRPALGDDMVAYHLPEVLRWVHDGRPGAVVDVIAGIPVGSYPLTHEVLLEWGTAVGRGFGWTLLVTLAMPVLIAGATWTGLRAVGADRAVAALGAAALVATPAVLASQSGGASVDPAALAWLVCCAALVAGARARPALLAPALVAGGMAVGTKSTVVPLTVAVLVLGAWVLRRRLRGLGRGLAGAGAVALAVGTPWYVRDVLSHGWPLWPFGSGPWGDPVPPLIARTNTSFLDRPGETLSRLGTYYWEHFGGPLILLAGAVIAAVVARTRPVLATFAVVVASALLWTKAPFTGVLDSRAFDVGTGDATRYLLPAVAAAVLAIALASRRERLRIPALVVLAAATAVGLYETLDLGFPSAPPAWVPLAGAAVGAVVVVVPSILPAPALPARATAALAVLVLALVTWGASGGFVARHARTGARGTEAARWLAGEPSWRDGHAPVLSTFSVLAPLAGDRLEHPLRLVRPRSACRRAAAEHAWLVLDRLTQAVARTPGCGAPAHLSRQYAVYRPPAGG